MTTISASGPCAPIHAALPLLGAVAGFIALLAVLATT